MCRLGPSKHDTNYGTAYDTHYDTDNDTAKRTAYRHLTAINDTANDTEYDTEYGTIHDTFSNKITKNKICAERGGVLARARAHARTLSRKSDVSPMLNRFVRQHSTHTAVSCRAIPGGPGGGKMCIGAKKCAEMFGDVRGNAYLCPHED